MSRPTLPKFKLPKLKKLEPDQQVGLQLQDPAIPHFDGGQYNRLKTLGRGAFGEVSLQIGREGSTVEGKQIAVKSPHSINDIDLVRKEIRLLSRLDHPNIIQLLGCNNKNGAIALEYAAFDLRPFDLDSIVTSLSDLMHSLDLYTSDFEGFDNFQIFIGRDVARGLGYLHEMGIAHRDLKPANILVSNLHYANKQSHDIAQDLKKRPVVAKLTDFGEGRSQLIQTQSLCRTQTVNCAKRGTPAFHAPETRCGTPGAAMDLADIQRMDLWALGLIMWTLVNPGYRHPYQLEIQEKTKYGISAECALTSLLKSAKLPMHGPKYAAQRESKWKVIVNCFHGCCKSTPSQRCGASTIAARIESTIKTSDSTKGDLENDF